MENIKTIYLNQLATKKSKFTYFYWGKINRLSNVNALELQYLLNLYRDLGTDIFDTIDESIGFIDFYWKSIKNFIWRDILHRTT